MVITNAHRNTGIVVKHGTKLRHCVLMDSGGLAVVRLTEEGFKEWHELKYDLKEAAKKFLGAGEQFGITQHAKEELEKIVVS